ncbi:hypothetical protein K461DRAFT_277238 [Myriangium duriaei CBS 260.36]|uniref:Uncharacterized protein n=1 Tax=Myriangium duriaei CBS 260.36 TaxID=1168546 RepID=A0A9P4J633_9PEZI|nr:hypothetical protein K461DRAFT_277238 [Myriangium duriaei CBS 260.36]
MSNAIAMERSTAAPNTSKLTIRIATETSSTTETSTIDATTTSFHWPLHPIGSSHPFFPILNQPQSSLDVPQTTLNRESLGHEPFSQTSELSLDTPSDGPTATPVLVTTVLRCMYLLVYPTPTPKAP